MRDDGSTDNTKNILKQYENNSKIKYYEGENKGPAKSFMDLINKTGEYDYYAFADQDDVWNPKKIISAIKLLEKNKNEPAIYISALEIVDKNLNTIKIKNVEGNFCFEGEMIKNFATGCTMVLNQRMCFIIKTYMPNYIIMHDSWITRVCYAIGGKVVIDNNSYVKYRQHENNVQGYNNEGLKKIKKQFKAAFIEKTNMRENIAKELKLGYNQLLTADAKKIIEDLINYRKDKNAKKALLKNKKFRTNNKKINIKLKLAIILNKF